MTIELTTKNDIAHNEELNLFAKVESETTFEDGNEMYSLRDMAANQFNLKIWGNEPDEYDIKPGHWYLFSNALGDTFEEPMIESNKGRLETEHIKSIDIANTDIQYPQMSVQDIEDGQDIDIVAHINTVHEMDNGDVLCWATDIENSDFDIKLWAAEGHKYNLQSGNWYLFRSAKGDTYDDPMIDSNNGKMIDIPLTNINPEAISVPVPSTTKSDIEDDEIISIIGTIQSSRRFDDGNELYEIEDLNGDIFELKVWADEASHYSLSTGNTYLFRHAQGDTFDEPSIHSSHGEMQPLPIDRDAISP